MSFQTSGRKLIATLINATLDFTLLSILHFQYVLMLS